MCEMMATNDDRNNTTPDWVTTDLAVPSMPSMARPSHMDDNELIVKVMNNYDRITRHLPHVNGYDQWVDHYFGLMKSEWTRLRTFYARPDNEWPIDSVHPEDLANAGFFFVNSDRVQCAFCSGTVFGWQSGHRPLAEHSRQFPRCPFIMGDDVGNVAIDRDPIREANRGQDVCGHKRPTQHLLIQSIDVTNRSDAQMKTLNMSQYGVRPHNGPKNPDYASVDTRRLSYVTNYWDESIPVSVKVLADAGFYSIGMSDYVKCFYCDGVLGDWEREDDPWIEHNKWFADCQYVLLNKKQSFDDQCKQMMTKEEDNQTNYDSNSDSEPDIFSSSGYDSDEDSLNALAIRAIAEWMRTDIVMQMIDLNIGSVAQIKAALNKRWQDVKQPFTSFAQLYDALTEQWPESTQTTSHTLDHNYSSSGDDDYHSCGEELPSLQSSVLSKTPTISDFSVAPKVVSNESHLADKVEDNRLLCKICLDREMGVVFLPCGHQLACTQCAACVSDCPVCRQKILGTVRTFFA